MLRFRAVAAVIGLQAKPGCLYPVSPRKAGSGVGGAAWATLTLPKLSVYSRYSEDISCTEGAKAGRVGALTFPPNSVLRLGPQRPCPCPVTHLATVMGFGHQQHAADKVRGGHALGAFALSGDRGGDWCDQSSQLTPCKGNPGPGCAVHRPASPHCSRLRRKPGPGGWGRHRPLIN